MVSDKELLTIQEASDWATDYLGRDVSASNISYLIQYGRVKKYGDNNSTQVAKQDLVKYYKSHVGKRELEWKKELGEDLNWALSFDNLTEKERTKHVHRLHPYKGKFIPQLVEYFLDAHTDDFKKDVYFKPGDIVLDPLCGSGTTLVQASTPHPGLKSRAEIQSPFKRTSVFSRIRSDFRILARGYILRAGLAE